MSNKAEKDERSDAQIKLDMKHGYGSAEINAKTLGSVLNDVVGDPDNVAPEDQTVYSELSIKSYVAGYVAALGDARHNPKIGKETL